MISFRERAWDDYLFWQQTNKAINKRINLLIKDIQRNPFEGIGKPEPLKYEFSACFKSPIAPKIEIFPIGFIQNKANFAKFSF